MIAHATTFDQLVSAYRCDQETNDAVWLACTNNTDTVPELKRHRDWVEENQWGYGDRAFHFMWYLLLRDRVFRRTDPALLEIGVYKGQTISLWALIAALCNARPAIVGVSPFTGQPRQRGVRDLLLAVASRRYREARRVGNLHPEEDYVGAVHRIFEEFGLDRTLLQLVRGESQDPGVKERFAPQSLDVVYIDGGHRYEQVTDDLAAYGDCVRVGGYLVVDDAAFFLPGSRYWKGFESVSRAVDELDSRRFLNVLNVGHNRIFQRVT